MNPIKCALVSAFLALALAPATALAAPPVVSSSQPRELVADPDGPSSYRSVTLNGTDLALPSTNGYTFPNDVTLWVQWDGVWHRHDEGWSRITGWSRSSLVFSVPPLTHAGTLGTYLCVRDQGCSYYPVNVRAPATVAPSFVTTSYRHAVVDDSVGPNDFRRLMRVVLRDLDNYEDTQFWGMDVSVGYMNAADGVIDLWIKDNTPGRYYLWVKNRVGWSSYATVDLIAPPAVTSRTPGTLRGLPATVALTFRDEYSLPGSTWARLEVPGCSTVYSVPLTQTSTLAWNAALPVSCRPWWVAFDATLVLENMAGVTRITVPVAPIIVPIGVPEVPKPF